MEEIKIVCRRCKVEKKVSEMKKDSRCKNGVEKVYEKKLDDEEWLIKEKERKKNGSSRRRSGRWSPKKEKKEWKAVLEAPARPALLSIFEGLTKKGDAELANALVPTTLDNVTKTQSRVDHPDGTYDLYALSTFESDSGAVKALEKLKSNFKGDTKAWEMQGWVHYISAPSGAKVLVIFKSRIANSIKKITA